jgi:hypothetical protein
MSHASYCTGAAGREANDATNSILCIDAAQQQKVIETTSDSETIPVVT